MIELLGIAVAGGVAALLVGGGLSVLVHVDRSTYEVTARPWDELPHSYRCAVTGVAYVLLVLGLVGVVSTLRALAAWI